MSAPTCGCCVGTTPVTPRSIRNRPGLPALSYRVGTHADFLGSMVGRLFRHEFENGSRPLANLSTRATNDPAIALLDAWATVADVLTFYQERIANEGYLATAVERRSVLELARLVGYRLRPGVAASVFLSFTMEKDSDAEIPAGTRSQSVPEPGQQPQVFETSEALAARAEWNAVSPRQSRPAPLLASDESGTLYLPGVLTGIQANDLLLRVCPTGTPSALSVTGVTVDVEADRTAVSFQPFADVFVDEPDPDPDDFILVRSTAVGMEGRESEEQGGSLLARTIQALRKAPSPPPASRFQLSRTPDGVYRAGADVAPRLLVQLAPVLRDTLYAAYAQTPVAAGDQPCAVSVMRTRAAPFGHNAPPRLRVEVGTVPATGPEWPLSEPRNRPVQRRRLSLDAVYEGIAPGSWVVVDRPDRDGALVTRVRQVRTLTRSDYGMSAKVTQLTLEDEWLDAPGDDGGGGSDSTIALLRRTTVYIAPEPLDLVDEPILDDIGGDVIELDGLYDGLEAGRWLVVRGTRSDVPGLESEDVEGIEASELVMLAGVVHRPTTLGDIDGDGEPRLLPGDTLHTRLILAEPLAYTYRRDSVRINANVVRATHGETRQEVLGSGAGSQPFQRFTLKQSPLTHLAAPTPSGVESTLDVRVDQVVWPQRESLVHLGPTDRGYVITTDDDGKTSVTFGDGAHGARLPTGVENVRAVYRTGIGSGGNVEGGQISVLATRPLGVKDVINPRRASGGVDPESRDQARRNVLLAVRALDRLVSVQDYADFARTFAGIGKASAARLTDGRREIVHLTLAGADDIPIDPTSDLYRNLILALHRFGRVNTPVRVEHREAVFLFVSARVRLQDDRLWSDVEPQLRAALLEAFGFERRALGEDALLSRVIATMQRVAGVESVDVDLFDAVSESDALDPDVLEAKLADLAAGGTAQPRQRIVVHLARRAAAAVADLAVLPAQLAYLDPDLPDTLLLTEATE